MAIQFTIAPRVRGTAILLGLAAAGCEAGRLPPTPSAPVQLLRATTDLTVTPLPELVVTLPARGREGRDFVDIRGVLAFPDGAIAVADAGVPQVYLFSPSGTLLAEMGRGGSGPGEFREPRLVAVWADSLAVYDPPQRRLTVFGRSGAFGRSLPVPSEHPAQVIGLDPDGSVLLNETTFPRQAREDGLTAARALLLRISGRSRDTLAQFADGLWSTRGYRFFAWRGAVASFDSILWTGQGNTPQLTRRGTDGTALLTLRWEQSARLVNEEDRIAMQAMARERGAAPDFTAPGRFADSVPLFARLLPDPLGGVWAIGYEPPFAPPEGAWRIDDLNLTIAKVELPPRFRPTQVGADFLLGVLTDEDGVGRPARFRLGRDATQSFLPASMP